MVTKDEDDIQFKIGDWGAANTLDSIRFEFPKKEIKLPKGDISYYPIDIRDHYLKSTSIDQLKAVGKQFTLFQLGFSFYQLMSGNDIPIHERIKKNDLELIVSKIDPKSPFEKFNPLELREILREMMTFEPQLTEAEVDLKTDRLIDKWAAVQNKEFAQEYTETKQESVIEDLSSSVKNAVYTDTNLLSELENRSSIKYID